MFVQKRTYFPTKLLVSSDLFHFSLQGSNSVGLRAGQQQYDEKNIRRRVYDALNVLMAMNIIFKDKKDIQWKGLPSASLDDVADLKVSVALFVAS